MRRFPQALFAVLLLPLLAALPTGCGDDDAAPPPPACGIEIYTPDPGAHFVSNNDVNIRWQASGGGSVSVLLLKANALVDTITAKTENDGYYWWPAGTMGTQSGDDFALRVASTSSAACADTVPISLTNTVGCVLTLTVDPDTTLVAGQDFLITWTGENTSGRVDLELWEGSLEEELVAVIAPNINNSGSYLWQNVDSYNLGTSASYYLRIADADPDVSGCDDMAGPIGIVDTEICYIDVTAPIDGQTFANGEQMVINFDSVNSSGLVNLRLYAGGMLVPGGYIADGVSAAGGTYTWTVSDFGFTGPNTLYRIVVIDATDQYCSGRSASFTIP